MKKAIHLEVQKQHEIPPPPFAHIAEEFDKLFQDRDGFTQGEAAPNIMTEAEIKEMAEQMREDLIKQEKEQSKELDAEWSCKRFHAAETWTPPPVNRKVSMFEGYAIWIVFAVVAATIVTLGAAYTPPAPYNYFAVFGALGACMVWLKALLWMDQFERYWGTQGYDAWAAKH